MKKMQQNCTRRTYWLRMFTLMMLVISGIGANAQCTNTSPFGTVTATNVIGSTQTVNTCTYFGEYNTINGVLANGLYVSTVTGSGFITVRQGSSSGPVIAFGTTPLSWTSTVAGSYFIHYNTNASCGTLSACQTTTLLYNGPASACSGTPNAGTATANGVATTNGGCPNQGMTFGLTGATVGSGLTYQWAYSSTGSGGPYAPVAGATNATYNIAAFTGANVGHYQCTVTCLGNSATSVAVEATLNSFLNCYCTPTNAGSACITNVTFAGINNTTAGCTGIGNYNLYSTLIANATQGQTVSLSVTCDAGAITSVWIDYNQDGIYSATEWSQIYTSGTTGTINVTIPMTATPGLTGVRIRSRLTGNVNGAGDACLNMGSGETEDYRININAATPCAGTPTPGNTLANGNGGTVTVCSGSTVNFGLQNFTNGIDITYQWFNGSGPIAGATNASYTTTITAADDYYCEVSCPSATPTTGTSNLVTINLDTYLNCYCPANSLFGTSGGFYGTISNVSAGSIVNSSGYPAVSPYYTNYPPGPGTTTNVLPGGLLQVNVSAGQYTQVGVWVDWDANGLFTDPGEFTFLGNNALASTVVYTANLNVPLTAPAGQVKMRIRAEAYFYANMIQANACGNLNYGETEDYTITIDPLVPCTGTPNPGNTLASAASVCPGASVTYTLQNNVGGTGISYQWFNGSGAVVGATNAFYTQPVTVVENVYCEVTCSNSSSTGLSFPVSVTLNPFISCYCASLATVAADEEIYQVTVNGSSTNPLYANANGCTTAAPGPGSLLSQYSNFLTIAPLTSVMQGSLVPFEVRQNECDGPTFFAAGIGVWADWNQDGDFTDAGEEVYIQPNTSAATGASPVGDKVISGIMSVPAGAVLGNTALRVICAEGFSGTSLTPCLQYGYGETEDHLITVTPNTNCSGTPAPGNTIASAGSVCPGSIVNLSLQNIVTGNGISYQWFNNATAIPGATNPTYAATITGPNSFYCEVTCSFSSSTGSSTPYSVLLNPFSGCYCASGAAFNADEEIYNVTVNGNSTDPLYAGTNGCTTVAPGPGSILGRYSNFTTLGVLTNIQEGSTATFTVEENECDGPTYYPFGTAIWIDLNQNGVFEEPGEKMFVENTTATGPRNVVGSFTLPFGIPTGPTGMRVTVAEGISGTALTPCLQYGYGETEDYLVNITAAPVCSGTPNPGNTLASVSSACPNTPFTLSLQNQASLGSGNTYQWYNGSGAIAGATNATYVASITASESFYCEVTCTASSQTGTSASVTVSINPFLSCYCSTGLGGICGTQSINSVQIVGTGLNNVTNGCTTPYSAFPAGPGTTATLLTGNTYGFNVGTGNNGNPAQIAVWIDFDQSGTFDPSEFTLISASSPSGGNTTTNITIPVTALTGQTGMRVRADWEFQPLFTGIDACTNRVYGETEDYIIDIVTPTPCSGTPNPGNTLASASSVCPGGSVTLSLQFGSTLGTGITYQWYNLSGAIAGATNDVYTTTVTATDDYYCEVTCTNSSQTAQSSVVTVSVSSFFNCYCPTTNAGSACITNVTFGSLNNTTTGCPGGTNYNSFPTPNPVIFQGLPSTLSVTCDGGAITSVWIDYNHDGVYDASEWNQVYTNALTGSISITVPGTALTGLTGMRIRSRLTGNQNGASDACLAMGSGETEDYIIDIQVPVGCTGTPVPGNTLATTTSACNNSPVTLSLQNQVSLGSGNTYQWFDGGGAIAGATNSTYTFNFTGTNTYYCEVTCTNTSQSAQSTPVTINPANFMDCYCGSSAAFAFDEEIYSVTLNGASTDPLYAGSNGCTTVAPGPGSILGRYSNFKTLGSLTSVQQGSTVPFTVQEDECDGPTYYPFGTGIWIDFNQDGDFDDAGEAVFIEAATATGPRSINDFITVPLTAATGNTVMRVTVAEGVSGTGLTPCLQYGYGETEDFLINITPAPTNTVLNLNLFIQGYWDGVSAMQPVLFNQGQTNPNTDCDSILVELHDAVTPSIIAYSTTAVLQTNGTAVCTFPASISGNYYIAVKHRNAIETWSANPVTFGPVVNYDFTTASNQAYGDNMFEVATGIWAFYSGDIVKDAAESTDLIDLSQLEIEIANFSFGYYAEDLTGDGNVDLNDSPLLEANVLLFISSVHP